MLSLKRQILQKKIAVRLKPNDSKQALFNTRKPGKKVALLCFCLKITG